MTAKEALKILAECKTDDPRPSKLNKFLSRASAWNLVNDCIVDWDTKHSDKPLDDIFVKRVMQVSQNRVRPKLEPTA